METKRFLKKFDSQSDYESQKDSVMNESHVVFLKEEQKVVYSGVKSDPFNGYEYVDLGLPSGTLWATKPIMNANDEVLYFQWGDTEGWTAEQVNNGEKAFASDGSDYKWNEGKFSGDGSSMTKYNAVDGKVVLDLEDDAAHVHMGGDWHIPTEKQCEELLTNTTSTWTNVGGVNGRLFTAPNGQSLFVPAFGYVEKGVLRTDGFYWSSTIYPFSSNGALYLAFGSSFVGMDYSKLRISGIVVLGVVG